MKARDVRYLWVLALLALAGCGAAEAAGGADPPMDPGGGPPDLAMFGCNAAIKLMENGGPVDTSVEVERSAAETLAALNEGGTLSMDGQFFRLRPGMFARR